jgi:hypothetical protein
MTDGLPPHLRDELVRQDAWRDDTLARHAQEVNAMIEKEVAALARERRLMRPMFIYLTIFCTVLLVVAGFSADDGRRTWLGIQACFWFIFGAVILLRYHVNRVRVELMVDLKQIQVELARLRAPAATPNQNAGPRVNE